MGIDNNSKTLLGIFQEHNDKCKGLLNIDFAPGTVERYITCRKHVEEFIKLKYKKNDLFLNEITPMFISDFEYYLKTTRKCCHNSTVKYIKNLKKIIRIALANGWMMSDPFANIKYHLDDVDLAYLTEEELNIMMKREFKIERLQQVKDAYLFCCFTGLAFIDVKNLIYADIEDRDGKLWIKKKRQKTKNWCNVPLLTPAINLMNKYKSHPECVKNGLVLPVLSNQKMNAYLKEIADLCEIQKNLSTHTARHTFATTVTLANQVSMEVVSKMLGHSSIDMTKKYARVVDDLINRDMTKIYDKYN
jgi:site-specific recombinase XerD